MTTNGTDPQEITGWTTQTQAPNPYAQLSLAGVPSFFAGNGSPGAPNPLPGNVENLLRNPGYACVNPAYLTAGVSIPAALVPVPASGTAFQSPSSLACTVVISGGTISSVKTAPYGGTLSQVGTADGSYTVPSGGLIEMTYSAAPTWTWTTAATAGAA